MIIKKFYQHLGTLPLDPRIIRNVLVVRERSARVYGESIARLWDGSFHPLQWLVQRQVRARRHGRLLNTYHNPLENSKKRTREEYDADDGIQLTLTVYV